jgi:hypothetical protein
VADGHLTDWWDGAAAKFLTLSNSRASLVPGQSTTSAYRAGTVLPPSVARPWLSPKLGGEAFVYNADGYQAFKKRTSVSMDSGYLFFLLFFLSQTHKYQLLDESQLASSDTHKRVVHDNMVRFHGQAQVLDAIPATRSASICCQHHSTAWKVFFSSFFFFLSFLLA